MRDAAVAEISKALQQMDVMTRHNAARAGQSADAARSLEATSQRLTDLTSQFEVGDGRPRLAQRGLTHHGSAGAPAVVGPAAIHRNTTQCRRT
jgi:hypothetical protein